MSAFGTIFLVSAAAALASPLGGLIAIWRKPNTLLMSLALGFAAGTLLGTIAFSMVPEGLEKGSLAIAAAGITGGFLAVFAFDIFVQRGRMAGAEADQKADVDAFHRTHRPRGDAVTVLAGGTSGEELIEGLSIGIGSGLDSRLGFLIGAAIFIDNVAEALSIGELVRSKGQGKQAWRIMRSTGIIGVALFASAMAGWFGLRDLPEPVLGALLSAGGGAMLYLTVTNLIPEGDRHHYQQSSALALCAGFLLSLVMAKIA